MSDELRVYHRAGAGRPIRVVWTLEEIGAPYRLIVLTAEQTAADEHLARHPIGRVPVIEDDRGPLFESTALCLHLADQHPEAALIPAVGTHERALVYQWSIFSMTEIEPALLDVYRLRESHPDLAEKATERCRKAVSAVEAVLRSSPSYLVADRFTVADIVLGEVTRLAVRLQAVEPSELLTQYLSSLKQRPARVRAQAALA